MAVGLHLVTREAVDEALREFSRLGRDAFLEKYGFGRSREYVVRDPVTGEWADSKAIVGAAYGFRFPDRGALRASEFSGGQAHVVRLLRELGYDVASGTEEPPQDAGEERGWARAEVELVVADYLQMLALELAGQSYNKAARRRALVPLLNGRSEASVEFKRRNISAVLLELGYPCVRGYLPAYNRQSILLDVVEQQLAQDRVLDDLARSFIDAPALPAEPVDFHQARVDPPRRERHVREPTQTPRKAVSRDYLEREARNISLGRAGELFVLHYEQWRLATSGLGQLADRVRHVSVEEGDGLGYDILSFNNDASQRFIEVKTTSFGGLTPFFVSANEAQFARDAHAQYILYRLFEFKSSPKFFELRGAIENHCSLNPSTYRASLF